MGDAILIVDDDDNKIKSVKAVLLENGISAEEIFSASDAAAARKLLSSRSFRLLLLDLNLPLRKDSLQAPSAEVGLELLKQIVEDVAFSTPELIVGITADISSQQDYQAEFGRLTSQILLVSPGQFDWKYSLSVLAKRIKNKNITGYDIDICIISALRIPEQSQVLSLPYGWQPEETIGNGILFRRGVARMGGADRTIISLHLPQMGPVASTFLSRVVIDSFRPRLLLMNGICGGLGEKPELGDLVIADKSWDWQSGKWNADGLFENGTDPKEASSELYSLALGLTDNIPTFYNDFKGVRPKSLPKVLPGPMVSGSSVVADAEKHTLFFEQHRKSLAIDMECYGVYYAARMSPTLPPKALCIKAVSDLADREKSDDIQEFCSYISARAVFEVARKFFEL